MKKIGFGKKKHVVMTEKEYEGIQEHLHEAAWRLFYLKAMAIDEIEWSVDKDSRDRWIQSAIKTVEEVDEHVENARDILRL